MGKADHAQVLHEAAPEEEEALEAFRQLQVKDSERMQHDAKRKHQFLAEFMVGGPWCSWPRFLFGSSKRVPPLCGYQAFSPPAPVCFDVVAV